MADQEKLPLPPMADALDVGIIVHEPETGENMAVNSKSEQIYGYPADQLRAMTVGDFTPPSTRHTQENAIERIQQAAAGEPQLFDWQIECANGELRWVTVHLERTTIADATVVLGEIRDITDQRGRERRLRLLSRIIRHNLRNQMMVIEAHARRVSKSVEESPLTDHLETVVDVASDVGETFESVRQIEAIADPNGTQRSLVNLVEVVETVCTRFSDIYPAADLTVESPDEVQAVADEGLKYALEQAIENAIEHNDCVEPTVTVTVKTGNNHEKAVIRISDDGPCIPAVEQEVLNEMVEATSTYHGTGAGLWVMQWCVNSLGGTLSFEAKSPRGNIVEITVPKPDEPSTHPPLNSDEDLETE